METTLTKISIKGEGSSIKVGLAHSGGDGETHTDSFPDIPKDSFLGAIRKFDGFIGGMVDIPPENVGVLKCHTVSIERKKSLKIVTLSATKKLANGKAWNFNTPSYIEAADPGSVKAGNLPTVVLNAVNESIKEAEAYYDGERSQHKMNLDDAPETEPTEAGEQTTLTEVDSDTQMEMASKVSDGDATLANSGEEYSDKKVPVETIQPIKDNDYSDDGDGNY